MEKLAESTEWVPAYELIARIKKEEKKIRKEAVKTAEEKGLKKGIKKVAKEMIKNGISMEIISRSTGLSKEEIDKLK